GNTRSVNHRGTLQYLRRIQEESSPIDEQDQLTEDQQHRERFVFGMRQRKGVVWDQIQAGFSIGTCDAIQRALEKHIAQGWIEQVGQRVRLTRAGLVISDGLWHEYLTCD
ncbi:MAG: coproporphyrinogen III oxidase family protein, partial [Planctomycetota bacterium]